MNEFRINKDHDQLQQSHKLHQPYEQLQYHTLIALTNLTYNSLENRSRCLEAHGIEALFGLYEHYKASERIVEKICWVLRTLIIEDDLCKHMIDIGGVSSLTSIMITNK
jgi:hypothetical protein